MASPRDILLANLAAGLSADIPIVMEDEGISLQEVVDRVIPKGSHGAQYHRPFLKRAMEALLSNGEPLEPMTCLQVCAAFDWPIGILEDDE